MRPKKLNLDEIWRLYLILQPAIADRQQKELLLDEVDEILTRSKQGTLLECLSILYDNKDIKKIEPGKEYIKLFMQGLLQNHFFDFAEYIAKGV